jgi:hypothetical protein
MIALLLFVLGVYAGGAFTAGCGAIMRQRAGLPMPPDPFALIAGWPRALWVAFRDVDASAARIAAEGDMVVNPEAEKALEIAERANATTQALIASHRQFVRALLAMLSHPDPALARREAVSVLCEVLKRVGEDTDAD